jgi:ribosomal protein S18 acetylase RimI-like enzyme
MNTIVKCTTKHIKLLSKIGEKSFLEAHGHSAPKKDIGDYISKAFCEETFLKELSDLNNIYHLIYNNNKVAGYSKIIFNSPNKNIPDQNITKLERIYLLQEFYGKNIGSELFNFNMQLSKENKQKGVWLLVWVENKRAINFYKKLDFELVGSYDFKVSATHSNPNHVMYLNHS